jgi:hypothetical protein
MKPPNCDVGLFEFRPIWWTMGNCYVFLFCFFFACPFLKARCDVTTCYVSMRRYRSVGMSAPSFSECTSIKHPEDKPSRIPLLPEFEPGFEPLLH